MTNVTRNHHALPLRTEIADRLRHLESALTEAIRVGSETGVPQGLILSVLDELAHKQAQEILEVQAK